MRHGCNIPSAREKGGALFHISVKRVNQAWIEIADHRAPGGTTKHQRETEYQKSSLAAVQQLARRFKFQAPAR
jgi:hypothetical protein